MPANRVIDNSAGRLNPSYAVLTIRERSNFG